jgi:flagellar biosynthesis protein FlhB
MAQEDSGQTRTETPTPRRREQARAEGQVAFSADLTAGLMLLAGVGMLAVSAQMIGDGLLNAVRAGLLHCDAGDLDTVSVQARFMEVLGRGLHTAGIVFLGMLAVGIAAPALQVGFHLSPALVSLKFERLAPTTGWGKMFSLSSGVRGLIAVLKVVAAGAVACWVLRRQGPRIAGMADMPLSMSISLAWTMVVQLALAIAATLLVLGIADYGWQRWRHEQSLRMTRQEFKDELKHEEGDPQIKARIRKLQRDAAQKRMMHNVPAATVVITNPTHLAVALRYDAGTMVAPKVVAKGAGFVAQRIAAAARRHGVPVIERKPLAQALYKTANIGQEVPAPLYILVAEVIAYVYKLRGVRTAAS